MCGKVSYADKQEARKALKHMNSHKPRFKAQRYYYCKECDAWHLTSKPTWTERV